MATYCSTCGFEAPRHWLGCPNADTNRQPNPKESTMPNTDEPLTIPNALDVLRTWAWLYDELRRSDNDTDEQVREGVAKGRNRQCSIGWHEECSDRSGINHRGECSCPCHGASWEAVGRFMRWMDECLTAVTAGEAPDA